MNRQVHFNDMIIIFLIELKREVAPFINKSSMEKFDKLIKTLTEINTELRKVDPQ